MNMARVIIAGSVRRFIAVQQVKSPATSTPRRSYTGFAAPSALLIEAPQPQ